MLQAVTDPPAYLQYGAIGLVALGMMLVAWFAYYYIRTERPSVKHNEAIDAMLRSALAMENMSRNLSQFIVWTQRLADSNTTQHHAIEERIIEVLDHVAPRRKRENGGP
jgi:hypothetical protein